MDCEIIMSAQGELEETGNAKITRAYNLPSRFVLHTVGPIVPRETMLTEQQKDELASCYISCLDLANEIENIKTDRILRNFNRCIWISKVGSCSYCSQYSQ